LLSQDTLRKQKNASRLCYLIILHGILIDCLTPSLYYEDKDRDKDQDCEKVCFEVCNALTELLNGV